MLVMLVLALYAGKWVAGNPELAPMFTLSGTTLSGTITRLADFVGSYYA